MSGSPTFLNLLDDVALVSLEHQLHLSELLGDHSWEADLSEPSFGFTGNYPLRCTAVHLVGSAAPGPRSWLWGWANQAGYPRSLLALGEYVRTFGQQHGIPELSAAEVPFDALPGSPAEPAVVAGMMMEAAKSVSGRYTAYTGEVGGGTRAVFIIEHPEFQLPPPQSTRVMRVLQQSLTDLALTDHRRAFHSYAIRRGLQAGFAGNQLRLTGPGFGATVEFTEQGLVSGISAQLGAGG